MTPPDFNPSDLDVLLQAYLDERLSTEDVARVEALLSDDARARERMIQILGIRGLIAFGGASLPEGRLCQKTQRWMPSYRVGTLAQAHIGPFARHIDQCLRCQQVWRAYERGQLDLTSENPSRRRLFYRIVLIVLAVSLALALAYAFSRRT